ncbi:DMT family transporter [Roseicyclus mahoneyensis]|uniref:Drug/metabolite transporter (DMT)-like permease n=1 Tax=Roseicyclus mahoneyensis TaxID=164332 RepID=A0A316GI35_9RHOB|nr:DMT family transporter [Roseicyclus mahoneyensis]PWK60240.1 drug/metabolite transporter (DMT)-like permease [Roseicyclus mahoneyensis]
MSSENATQLRGVALALAAFGIFATHDVLIKYLGGSYSPFQIVFFSVLFGFPMVTLLMMRDAKESNLRPVYPMWTGLRTAATVITAATAFYAFSVLPLAQVYAILFAAPLLITLLAIPMLGEKVGIRRGGAVLVGLCGVLIVLQPGATDLTWGHLAALVAAVTGAFGAVIMRKIGQQERSVVLILYPMMANVVVMGAALPFVYQPMPGQDMLALAVIAAFALIATTLLIFAYRLAPAATVAPMQYSQILWATVYGLIFFDEGLEWATVIGTGVIVASGVYIVFREDRGGTSTTTPVLRTRSRVGAPSVPRVASLLPKGLRGPQHSQVPDGADD